jgi:hypothetical protein
MKEIKTQSLLGNLFFDEQTISKLKTIINSIDEEKIKMILAAITKDEEGWLNIKINLKVKT